MVDRITEMAIFGSARAWERKSEGDEPLARATEVREALRALWREAKDARSAIEANDDLSATGKQKAIAKLTTKLDQLGEIQQELSPTELARGQLIGHRRVWEEAQPGDPARGTEIRSWLTMDPIENLRRLDMALVDGDEDTANAILNAPRSWPGWPRPSCTVRPRSIGPSASRRRRRHDGADGVPADRPPADCPGRSLGHDYLDLVEPAMMTIQADGQGEISFGAMQASLELEYSRSMVFFTWAGFDEMDDVSGSGAAELLDDGSIEIEFAYHHGDDAILNAKRATSSTSW
jgi:hypothetical protein